MGTSRRGAIYAIFFGVLSVGTAVFFGVAGWTASDGRPATTSAPDSGDRSVSAGAGIAESGPDVSEPTAADRTPGIPAATNSIGTARIVFAADFATNGGCADHGTTDRCDLFTASLDLSSGAVSSVRQATDTDSVSEAYPAWNPNGTVAYASVFANFSDKQVHFVNLSTGATGTLISKATWPEAKPDGSSLLYVTSDTGMLMSVPLTNGGLAVGSAEALTGIARQEDPDYSPDGTRVVFHQIGSDGAHGAVLDTATGKTSSWTERSGHCAFGLDGVTTICDSSKGGGLFERAYRSGTFDAETRPVSDLSASQMAAYDPVFSACGGTSFNYPTFCGDDAHILASVSCNTDASGGVSFSRLFLIDLSGATPVYRPIGKFLAEAFDGKGKSSWTVDCLSP